MVRLDDDPRLRPRLGRTRSRDHRRVLAATQIKRAMRAGGCAGPGALAHGSLPTCRPSAAGAQPSHAGGGLTRGWSQAQPGARRVVVKARYVSMPAGSRAAAVHLRYLQRDGVTRDGSPGQLYSATADGADGRAFLDRSEGDPRQFRLIVAAEDGRSSPTSAPSPAI